MGDTEKTPTNEAQPESAPEYPIPPATFEFLVLRTVTEAQMFLGMKLFGEEEAPPVNLKAAHHAIDLLAMLMEKTRGNLTLQESRFLENSLTELRFRYVQTAEAGRANG